jgi:hypothetical protein
VAAPAIRLATRTMVQLSDGYGRPTGLLTLGFWVFALTQFVKFLKPSAVQSLF